MAVSKHIELAKKIWKLEFKTATEYRINFISQTVGMIINDIFWVVFWFLLFSRFNNIAGWKYEEMLLIYAVFATSFGIVMVLFGNYDRIAKFIEEGKLDYYLTMPKNALIHLLIRMRYSGLGDLLFGLGIAAFTISWQNLPLYITLVISSTAIILGWNILINSIAFYTDRFKATAKAARDVFMITGFYPFSIYSEKVRLILLFIIPAGFAAGLPVELLITFNLKWFIIAVIFPLIFLAFSIWFFHKGLKRYESGNSMVMRG